MTYADPEQHPRPVVRIHDEHDVLRAVDSVREVEKDR